MLHKEKKNRGSIKFEQESNGEKTKKIVGIENTVISFSFININTWNILSEELQAYFNAEDWIFDTKHKPPLIIQSLSLKTVLTPNVMKTNYQAVYFTIDSSTAKNCKMSATHYQFMLQVLSNDSNFVNIIWDGPRHITL